MTQRFYTKPGARKRAIKYKLSDYEAGSAKLAGASVVFQLMDANRNLLVNSPGTIIDNDGIVGYPWGVTDLDRDPDTYYAEFHITYADSLVDKAPSDSFIEVVISEEVPNS